MATKRNEEQPPIAFWFLLLSPPLAWPMSPISPGFVHKCRKNGFFRALYEWALPLYLPVPPRKVMTQVWKTSSLHWISSHSEQTMLRGFQATGALMTQEPLIVSGDRGSVSIDREQGALLNAIDYLSWPSVVKRRQDIKRIFPEQQDDFVSLLLHLSSAALHYHLPFILSRGHVALPLYSPL